MCIVRFDSECIDMDDMLTPGTKDISIKVWFKRAVFGLIAKTNGDTSSPAFGYLLSFVPIFFSASIMKFGILSRIAGVAAIAAAALSQPA
jgi:hypothetical protein